MTVLRKAASQRKVAKRAPFVAAQEAEDENEADGESNSLPEMQEFAAMDVENETDFDGDLERPG